MAVNFLVVAAAISAFSHARQAAAFVHPGCGLGRHQGRPPRLTCSRLSPNSRCRTSIHDDDAGRHGGRIGIRRKRGVAQTQSHARKTPLTEDAFDTATEGRRVVAPEDGEGEGKNKSLLDELLVRCAEATKSDAATESSHTGSSEWAGFKTNPELLEVGVFVTPCCVGSFSPRSDVFCLCA